jgi:uncharacterized membrane protein YdcZ (DUF606 family)
MQYIGFVILIVFLIIWGTIDYYTEVNNDVSRWIRWVLWGPGYGYFFLMIKILSFSLGPIKMVDLLYCFLLLLISIPSLYCGHWAIESYNRQQKRKSFIISGINWTVGIVVSIFIFHFLNKNGAWHH